MGYRLRQWVLAYSFSEHYGSEKAWKEDFDKFCLAFHIARKNLG